MPLRVIVAWEILTALVLFAPRTVSAQGSGSTRVPNQGTQPYRPPAAQSPANRAQTPEEFYQTFWKHLVRQQDPYTKWAKLNEQTNPESAGPHGIFVKIYGNKLAAENPATMPPGAVLVAENYAKDQKTLSRITVMYRVKGYDPKANDWYWLEYLPNGSIARTPANEGNKAIAGKVKSCIDCHTKAQGKDFLFSNDPKEESAESQKPDGKPDEK